MIMVKFSNDAVGILNPQRINEILLVARSFLYCHTLDTIHNFNPIKNEADYNSLNFTKDP